MLVHALLSSCLNFYQKGKTDLSGSSLEAKRLADADKVREKQKVGITSSIEGVLISCRPRTNAKQQKQLQEMQRKPSDDMVSFTSSSASSLALPFLFGRLWFSSRALTILRQSSRSSIHICILHSVNPYRSLLARCKMAAN